MVEARGDRRIARHVPTEPIRVRICSRQSRHLRAQLVRISVLNHRALAPGIREQAAAHAQLEDPGCSGCMLVGCGQRIPRTKTRVNRIKRDVSGAALARRVHDRRRLCIVGSMVGKHSGRCYRGRLMRDRHLCFDRPGSEEADRLICGDNQEVLAALDDSGIDLMYIDPPFGTGRVRRGGMSKHSDDPVSTYCDVPDDPDRYVVWLRPRLEHCHRLLAAHGSLFVHLDYRTVHYIKVELDRIFGRARFINELIWCYSVGGKSKRMFGRKHDTILWYARSADHAFFPDAIKVPRKPGSHMRVIQGEDGQLIQEKTDRKTGKVYRYPVDLGKIPDDWWTDIELLNRSDAERTGWPTQKPERLLERIIRAASAPGALVADWFCGSGTTAVVAQRLDRRFVAVDAEPAAIEHASRRLEASGRVLAASGQPPRTIAVRRWKNGNIPRPSVPQAIDAPTNNPIIGWRE